VPGRDQSLTRARSSLGGVLEPDSPAPGLDTVLGRAAALHAGTAWAGLLRQQLDQVTREGVAATLGRRAELA
jgi:hypothetical protein